VVLETPQIEECWYMNRTTIIILSIVGVLALCCIGGAAVLGVGGMFVGQTIDQAVVESPEEAAAVGQGIVDYTLPAGYQELVAFNMFGTSIVMIGSNNAGTGPNMAIMLASFSSGMMGDEQQMREQMRDAFSQQDGKDVSSFSTTSTEEITINGEPTTLVIAEGTSEEGERVRQASATFTTNDGNVGMLMIIGTLDNWDQDAVDTFLNSLR
jgi:hypothetical protein